ncbi:uncharacterized protein LOC133188395 [Saccostrea echinata]|uniref:uncharacterized protein LOC133188395 n=1 Tax=Saccostrea echinata TaxID=191078 RepID=UPI002A83520B|nr:uncharacterized protein LOC133188395 [Saccostrea echinata]
MAYTFGHLSLLCVFASTVLLDLVEARYCYSYYDYYLEYYNYYCTYYLPIGTIAGGVIGALSGLAVLIGLLVYFCCIRPRRLAARGTVFQPAGSNVAVVATPTEGVQYGGGFVNPAAYPPGTQLAYPQYTYPPQQQGPPTGYQPPPTYK